MPHLYNDAKPGYYDLCYQLHLEKFPLDQEIIAELRNRNYFGDKSDYYRPGWGVTVGQKNKYIRPKLQFKNDQEKAADDKTIIVDSSKTDTEDRDLVDRFVNYADEQAFEQLKVRGFVKYKSNVQVSDWKIPYEELMDHRMEFVNWINSINSGFQNKINYWRFDNYKLQAEEWLADPTSIHDFENSDDKVDYVRQEMERSRQNSYYYLDKYWKYKSAETESGFLPFISSEAHKVVAFLIDSGYDCFFAKSRQVAFTTEIFGIGLKETSLNKSYFISMATADEKKAIGTFNEKAIEPYNALTKYVRPVATSKTQLSRRFHADRYKEEAGGSTFQISTASPTLTNSGTPKKFFVDEAGLIDCLAKMIDNWFPTAEVYNHEKKILEKINQIIVWGTSDSVDFPDFEEVFTNLLDQWEKKNWYRLIIPVFFNWAARLGMTREKYDALRKRAFDHIGADREDRIREFKQAYPDTIDDMFVGSPDTIIPMEQIKGHVKRIDNADANHQCRYGYFVPVYAPGSATKKPISAIFEECDRFSPRVSVVIYRKPEEGWKYRYFKGTDPIAHATGLSNFATAIWDNQDRTIAAAMYGRAGGHKFWYEQSLCLHLYYDRTMPDLIEHTGGQNYIDYLKDFGYHNLILPKLALPRWLQTGSANPDGIDNKANTNVYIMQEVGRMLDLYADNIWIKELFHELRTFTRKKRKDGRLTDDIFKVSKPEVFKDDLVFGSVYAKICAGVHDHKAPIKTTPDDSTTRKLKYEVYMDENYRMRSRETYNLAA
jgi:hypothetical protein